MTKLLLPALMLLCVVYLSQGKPTALLVSVLPFHFYPPRIHCGKWLFSSPIIKDQVGLITVAQNQPPTCSPIHATLFL
uniref:Secreted protein n=1 Tax=Echinococcus granulosus TaxID=6210 RepID=A0A068X5B6_ECHGR|nr:hypothetical protein EgrG_001136700 [Echinococcus granulosus]